MGTHPVTLSLILLDHCVDDLLLMCSEGTELKHRAASSSTFFFSVQSLSGMHVCARVALHAFSKPFSFASLLAFDGATCMQKFRPLSALCCACSVSSEFPQAGGLQNLAFCY